MSTFETTRAADLAAVFAQPPGRAPGARVFRRDADGLGGVRFQRPFYWLPRRALQAGV